MRTKKNDAGEVLGRLRLTYVDVKDISYIACCGLARAYKIKRDIEKQYKDKYLPSGLIPSNDLIKYLGLDIEQLKIQANLKRLGKI